MGPCPKELTIQLRDLTNGANTYTMEGGEERKEADHRAVFTLLLCISDAHLVGS